MKNHRSIAIIGALTLVVSGLVATLFFGGPKVSTPRPEPEATLAPKIENTTKAAIPESSQASKAPATRTADKTPEDKKEPTLPQNTENITIVAGEKTAEMSVISGTTFYDAIVKAEQEGLITFEGKNYPGLGFFVTDIGTLHSGDGLDLLYYINGTEATVGVSLYIPEDGDTVLWKLE